MRVLLGILAVALLGLVVTNPNEADFREHVREQEGLVGTLGLAVADLLSANKRGGIQRENYLFFSRFYLGGDGLLPREDVAWGIAGVFFEIGEGWARSRRSH